MYEEKRWMSRITALLTGTWGTTLPWRPLMGPCPCAGEHQMAYIPPALVEEGASHQCWLQGGAPCRIRWWQSVIAVEVNSVLTGTEDKSVKGVDNMHMGVQNLHFPQLLFLKLYHLEQQWTRNKVRNEWWSLKQPLGLLWRLSDLKAPPMQKCTKLN